MRQMLEERHNIPQSLYNQTPFFAEQDRLNRLILNSLSKIQIILIELTEKD